MNLLTVCSQFWESAALKKSGVQTLSPSRLMKQWTLPLSVNWCLWSATLTKPMMCKRGFLSLYRSRVPQLISLPQHFWTGWAPFSLMTRRVNSFPLHMMMQVSWEETQVVCRRRCKMCIWMHTVCNAILTNLTSSCRRWHLTSQELVSSFLTWLDYLPFFQNIPREPMC